MAMDHGDGLPETEKVRIASNFILHSPPGEFNEVFNDVRLLLNNDTILKEGCSKAFAQYNKDQFTPAKLEGSEKPTLITPFNDIGNGRFYDPRSNKSFKFDHLRKEASELGQGQTEPKSEPWRAALQAAIDPYVQNHYKFGTAAVFGTVDNAGNVLLHLCIEAHQFQPKNFHNGRWRSQWSVHFGNDKGIELKGVIKVQVHYYEDGNVQLVSSKEINRKLNAVTGETAAGKEIAKAIAEEEGSYHNAVCENYSTMSETTFKALRRQLPVTRTKIEWGKIHNYKIGTELRPQ